MELSSMMLSVIKRGVMKAPPVPAGDLSRIGCISLMRYVDPPWWAKRIEWYQRHLALKYGFDAEDCRFIHAFIHGPGESGVHSMFPFAQRLDVRKYTENPKCETVTMRRNLDDVDPDLGFASPEDYAWRYWAAALWATHSMQNKIYDPLQYFGFISRVWLGKDFYARAPKWMKKLMDAMPICSQLPADAARIVGDNVFRVPDELGSFQELMPAHWHRALRNGRYIRCP